MAQCSPPGYVLLLCRPESMSEWPEPEDVERFKALPHDARLSLERYVRDMKNRRGDDHPCIWLDLKTKRCRWYDYRPQICRDFDVGSEGCQAWRDEYNVDVAEITRRV